MPTTLRTLALAWRKAKEPLIKRSSLYAYQINIKNYLLPRWGEATEISEAAVSYTHLRAHETGNVNRQNGNCTTPVGSTRPASRHSPFHNIGRFYTIW